MLPIQEDSTGVGFSACTGSVYGSFTAGTVSGLEECQQNCLLNPLYCNTINYCNDGTLCPTYSSMIPYCTLKKCTGDDYVVNENDYGKFDIYTKMNGIYIVFYISHIRIIIFSLK